MSRKCLECGKRKGLFAINYAGCDVRRRGNHGYPERVRLMEGPTAAEFVLPGKSITPPLSAVVEVVSCDALEGDQAGTFLTACSLVEILDSEKLGKDFP